MCFNFLSSFYVQPRSHSVATLGGRSLLPSANPSWRIRPHPSRGKTPNLLVYALFDKHPPTSLPRLSCCPRWRLFLYCPLSLARIGSLRSRLRWLRSRQVARLSCVSLAVHHLQRLVCGGNTTSNTASQASVIQQVSSFVPVSALSNVLSSYQRFVRDMVSASSFRSAVLVLYIRFSGSQVGLGCAKTNSASINRWSQLTALGHISHHVMRFLSSIVAAATSMLVSKVLGALKTVIEGAESHVIQYV